MDFHSGGNASELRRLDPHDFGEEQIAGWIAAAGEPEAEEVRPPEAGPVTWRVGYTDPRREDFVAKAARQAAFDAYVPAMTVTIRGGRDVRRPVFPRYVLLGCPEGRDFYALRSTTGFEGLVRCGAELAQLSRDQVAGLRAQEDEGVFDFTKGGMERRAAQARAERLRLFRVGASVRIMVGPWRSFAGVVAGLLPPDRLSVGIMLFGRPWPVPMMVDAVEPV